MTFHTLSRWLRPALALPLALALPAAAQSFDAALAALSRPEGQEGQIAALAACLADGGTADAVRARFASAGWAEEVDGEMGLIDFALPAGGLAVTLAGDGSFCEVASETIGTATAAGSVARLAEILGTPLAPAKGPLGCLAFTLAGATVEVTSTGQDPSCDSDTTSAIRAQTGG